MFWARELLGTAYGKFRNTVSIYFALMIKAGRNMGYVGLLLNN